ncbi:HD domain-containing protein [Candidatus Poribacteria bacterium]|nr:HD domain-containing protein [Candidatus Poribacteria bacterium]
MLEAMLKYKVCDLCGKNIRGNPSFCYFCGSKIKTGAKRHNIQQKLIEISRIMNSTLDLDSLLTEISTCACELTDAETGSTMLYDPNKDELYFKVALGEKKDILKRLSVNSSVPSIAWWSFKNCLPAIVNDTSSDERFGGSVDKVTSFKTKSILCVPIIISETKSNINNQQKKSIGIIEVINKNSDDDQFTVDDLKMLNILAYQAAIAVKNAISAGNRRNFFVNAIEIFITAIESSGLVPSGHCMNVARTAMKIARELDMKHDELQNIYYASTLHDMGILDIRCNQSEGQLSRIPEVHTILGAEMVKPVGLLNKTETMIRHHHEAWNGTGFPDRIKGYDIPIGARIIAIAEAYEESNQDDEYIASNSDILFDPILVDIFLDLGL